MSKKKVDTDTICNVCDYRANELIDGTCQGCLDHRAFMKKIVAFVNLFERDINDRRERLHPYLPHQEVDIVESGYKFCKVFISGRRKKGRYMVERATENIYGVKSWTQVNLRRMYGTLDTIDQFDWSEDLARPLPSTPAEQEFHAREVKICKKYKKRGRKKKSDKLTAAGVRIPKKTFIS